jgi:8-oxo-dGTP pyrophosphatase MutT (NUDIX family)
MKEQLKQLLADRREPSSVETGRVAAAVLLPLFLSNGKYHILFIKRTETVKAHKGQISFPGGTREKGESLLETALRECTEEIGLKPEDVEILGQLNDEPTASSNFMVSPFVGIIPWPYAFKLEAREVAHIIVFSVDELLAESCRLPYAEPGHTDPNAYAYYCEDRVIWGATARILDQFLVIFTRAMQEDTSSNK